MRTFYSQKSKNIRFNTAVLILLAVTSNSSCLLLPKVHYVLPDGYVGIFKIVLDETNGIDVNKNWGQPEFAIPRDGILRVKSFCPFEASHEVMASYRDGSKILVEDSTVKRDEIAIRNLGLHTRDYGPETIILLVGTQTQAEYTNTQIYSDSDFWDISTEVFNQRLKQVK